VDDVLIGLDPEQREVAEAVRGPVCVLAGAGTGKTRAITHRIAYAVRSGVVDAQSVLAVTFTTRAAGELRHRLRALGAPGVQARTFHAAALRQLTYFWPRVIGGEAPSVIESKVPVLTEASRRLRMNKDRSELRDVAAEIEWAKVHQIGPEDYAEAVVKMGRTPAKEVVPLYTAYEEIRRERHLVDFETILELTAAVMTEHQEVAAQVRQQYRYFVVDEYQDVNPLQKLLLDTWLGGRDDICVVGDPNQTIYSFTGASPRYLTNFAVEYPKAAVVRLVRNYRSTPQVVNLGNLVIAKSANARHRHELVAQRPDGPNPVFTEYDDEPSEARGVAGAIRKLIDRGVPSREIAVLFRINAQSAPYEEALSKAEIPYIVRGAERFFDRPEIKKAVVLLRGAARSAAGEPLAPEVHNILAGAGLTPSPPGGGGEARERWESLKALADLAEDMAALGADLPAFVEELQRRMSEQDAPPVEGVTLASLHAAKGLEWDAVFLVGLTDGMVPYYQADAPEQIEEERRLLYVGITRAREHLGLSWALARAPEGRRTRRPSRFLDGLTGRASAPPRVAPASRERRTVAAPVSCRVCAKTLVAAAEQKLGRCATCPADYDEALLERLKAWRTATAKEAKLPPYVVFTDVTLQAIAERAPTTEQELLSIAGIGRVKADRYGEAVISLCRGT
jgi:DNA helicase-2/ATP-dependent DNA helicase PcrA